MRLAMLKSCKNFKTIESVSKMEITDATLADLPEILRIEQLGFTAEEAGTAEQYQDRLARLAGTFLVAKEKHKLVGFVVGAATQEPYVADWMFEHTPTSLPTGGHQLIYTIAIDPAYRGHGLGSRLLVALQERAQNAHRETLSLTSLERNVPFYLKNGFENHGVANSTHAGEVWFNLVKPLY